MEFLIIVLCHIWTQHGQIVLQLSKKFNKWKIIFLDYFAYFEGFDGLQNVFKIFIFIFWVSMVELTWNTRKRLNNKKNIFSLICIF